MPKPASVATRRIRLLNSLPSRLFFVIVFYRSILPNEGGVMPPGPAHADPAPEPGDPLPAPDWMSAAEWEAWCDATAVDDEPPAFGDGEDEEPDPGAWVGEVSGLAAGNLLDAMP